jgi:predicted helicase
VFYRLYNGVLGTNAEPNVALSNARHDEIKRHNNMTTIHEILNEFREAATSNRDMGDKFERLIATYLITDPFAKNGKEVDKTTIIVNSRLRLTGIPLEAYGYVINGKSAIEWVMERYQVTVDKDSGIRNDPNTWGLESGQPDYIVNLVKRVVGVSVETVKLVKALPALNEQDA